MRTFQRHPPAPWRTALSGGVRRGGAAGAAAPAGRRMSCRRRAPAEVSAQFAVERWTRGAVSVATDQVAEEMPVALVYHEVPHVVMLATPADLEDYAVGFTLSEGLVARADEIRGVSVTRGAAAADVNISVAWERFTQLLQRRRNLAGRTGCGLCGAETASDAIRAPGPVPDGVRVSADELHAAIEQLPARQVINARTGSVHAAAWVVPGAGIQVVREDVGRHNALDKTIGALSRANTDFSKGYMLITSRASYEMVQKARHRGHLAAGGVLGPDRVRGAAGAERGAHAGGVRAPRPARRVRAPAAAEMSGTSPGRALICGSVAYDTIMVFQDRFANHILPDKIHMLNVSFLVPQMRREFGGCAGNIAYNLQLLGDAGYPMATVGERFRARTASGCTQHGVPTEHVRVIEHELTAQAFITTDLDDNQITAFHPGRDAACAREPRRATPASVSLGIVAPDGREGMLAACRAVRRRRHSLHLRSRARGCRCSAARTCARFIAQARWVAVNDYEWQLVQQKTGWIDRGGRSGTSKALIVTRGAEGSTHLHAPGRDAHIPAAPASAVVDPTGCGDAYRAGLIHGLLHGLRLARPRDVLPR